MRARFHPQAWVNDNAIDVDPEGPTEWEVTPAYVEQLQSELNRPALVFEDNTNESDYLRLDPAAPEWVREWHGPHYVEIL